MFILSFSFSYIYTFRFVGTYFTVRHTCTVIAIADCCITMANKREKKTILKSTRSERKKLKSKKILKKSLRRRALTRFIGGLSWLLREVSCAKFDGAGSSRNGEEKKKITEKDRKPFGRDTTLLVRFNRTNFTANTHTHAHDTYISQHTHTHTLGTQPVRFRRSIATWRIRWQIVRDGVRNETAVLAEPPPPPPFCGRLRRVSLYAHARFAAVRVLSRVVRFAAAAAEGELTIFFSPRLDPFDRELRIVQVGESLEQIGRQKKKKPYKSSELEKEKRKITASCEVGWITASGGLYRIPTRRQTVARCSLQNYTVPSELDESKTQRVVNVKALYSRLRKSWSCLRFSINLWKFRLIWNNFWNSYCCPKNETI